MGETIYKGVPGILRPFKEYVLGLKLQSGSEIVFFGVPGTCLPFVELLCYSVRKEQYKLIFVPYLEIDKASSLELKDCGFQVGDRTEIKDPDLIVMMGGLTMPDSKISPENANNCIMQWPDAGHIGFCFMHMFFKTGWLDKINFDLIIDADITTISTSQKHLL